MAYDSQGDWKVEDDSVSSRLPGLMSTGSPLMQKAQGDAMRTANRRGLQNSSIAAGEGTKAALGVVVPIASQEAAQTSQKNLAAQGFGYNTKLTSQQIQGQKDVAGMQIDSAERIATGDRENRLSLQRMSDEGAMARTQLSETGATNRTNISEAGATNRTNISEAGATARNTASLSSNETIAREDRTARSADATADRAANTANAAADRTSRETIARDDRAASRSANISQGISNANSTYTNYVNGIMANENIPINERNRLVQDAAVRRDGEIEFLEQVFGINLSWARTAPQTASAGTPQPTPDYSRFE